MKKSFHDTNKLKEPYSTFLYKYLRYKKCFRSTLVDEKLNFDIN